MMNPSLEKLVQIAQGEARKSGFRKCGIYHLLRALKLEHEQALLDLLAGYGVDQPHFLKVMENVLRPRRAGGGIPQDRIDAELFEEALAETKALAASSGQEPAAEHLVQIVAGLSSDPILALCERYLVEHQSA